MSKLKEAKKTKVVALYKQIPKQFEPDPNPQNSLFLPPKRQKKTPKLDEIKSKNRRRHRKHMLFCYMSRPKTYFEP